MQERRVNPTKLAACFDRQQWKVREFVTHTGLSRSYYYSLKTGKRDMSLETALHLAKALECEVEDFSDPIHSHVDPHRSLRSA
jgi:DNA-binding Xre family transcriptional regulator